MCQASDHQSSWRSTAWFLHFGALLTARLGIILLSEQCSSIVRKLVPSKFKRSVRDYFALYRSSHVKKKKKERLTEKAIRYVIRQRRKGKSPSYIAAGLGTSPRYARKMWAKFQSTSTIPVPHSIAPTESSFRVNLPNRKQ